MPADSRPPRPIVTTLRPAGADDATVARVAGVLADAFLTDPYTTSYLPADRQRERLTDLFDWTVRDTLRPPRTADGEPTGAVDVAVDPVDGSILGAAVWERPGATHGYSVPAMVSAVPRLLRVAGRGAFALAATRLECVRARPAAPHWYLAELGTAQAARGRGVARVLVERRQRDAQAAGVGIHLESSTRANVPVYERFGFRETGRIRTYGTDDLTGMWWQA